MVELRRKIINFRTIIDLPPLTYYLSISNMVMRTMKDLHKLCPEIIDSSQILEMRREEVDKLLDNFYNALKSIGDSWIDDHEWIIKSKYRSSNIRKNLSDRLVEKVLAALDGLIKGMNERLNTTENGNVEMKKKVSPRSTKTSNDRSESLAKQPIRPKTVLSPPSKVHGDFSISVSNLPRNVRMQALVKLSPIDVKRLAIQNFSQKEALSNNGDGDDESLKVKKSETEEKAKEAILEKQDSVKSQIDDKDCSKVSVKSEMVSKSFAPPPPPPPGNAAIPVEPPLTMSAEKESYAPLPPPPGRAALPPPPPLPMAVRKGVAAPPLPPPGTAALPPPPPLPMAAGKGVAAPPPPPPGARGGLGAKKVTSKLKRSTHLGALFRFLKGKLEGKNPEVRSRGAGGGSKGATGSAPASGKQGMADALAEITKKSPYFQKIEEDVRMYMTSINELKTDITKFKNKDITELQKFHHRIESVLEKLEDETQVLARCEGFPHKKLEAIRMAAALYSKLEGMIKELKNWKIESPANQLYDKTERYFAKASHRNTDFRLFLRLSFFLVISSFR
ncbi:hydroxyproline-rich glycoprotein family protein [Arabidopsis thaliana]|nr:hydroxyproline-rich glycoprotein family protein [Arabidopsis thaliana]ANM60560.1 hydroxyproline-rich glycoprotein family protein [Arabidopsis thaliana]|eukprot:NP_001322838.1 hydroxyproline-rich glycoprotein family protein [Arabidopsis thaliana]